MHPYHPASVNDERVAAVPKGYFLAEVDVTKPTEYEVYRSRVLQAVENYGGRFLVRGGSPTGIEGTGFARRVIIIEFDSPEQAQAWYDSPEYQAIVPIRQASATTRATILVGA
jgi:uncharacterized protein (DUF1330 family)